jgi:hypothetical protein
VVKTTVAVPMPLCALFPTPQSHIMVESVRVAAPNASTTMHIGSIRIMVRLTRDVPRTIPSVTRIMLVFGIASKLQQDKHLS